MDKLSCMRAFCQVVKEGTFSAAAERLNISKVLVSRHVATLEEDLGVRLLRRTTRTMSLTDEGKAYFERCQVLLDDFDELDSAVKDQHQGVKGKLRISVPSEAFTCMHLTPFFTQFAKAHVGLHLDIVLSDRYIDIIEEGFDAAVRIGQLSDSSLIAKPLAGVEIIVCASKRYLDANPLPIDTPAALEQHALVVDTNYRAGRAWKFSQGGEQISVSAQGAIRVNSSQAVRQFLLADLGIGLTPSFMVANELASGELVRLLPNWQLMRGGIYIVYSHRSHLSSKVSTLVSALAEYFSQFDELNGLAHKP